MSRGRHGARVSSRGLMRGVERSERRGRGRFAAARTFSRRVVRVPVRVRAGEEHAGAAAPARRRRRRDQAQRRHRDEHRVVQRAAGEVARDLQVH